MGTNYYAEFKSEGGSKLEKHIGKSSAGWVFSLHVYPEEGIHGLNDWKKLLFSNNFLRVRNEYREKLSIYEVLKIIEKRSGLGKYPHPPEWFLENNAVPGPSNLARHKLGKYCIRHGPGTYDYIIGDFS